MTRRHTSAAGLALIRRFEGFSPTVYVCPAGRRTIGHGHVIRDPSLLHSRITQEQAAAMLVDDLAPVEIYLSAVLPDLTQNQFDALASFCFNVGLGAFEKSTLFARLKAGDVTGAASQFARWTRANGRELPGLVRRREAERSLFLSPEDPA